MHPIYTLTVMKYALIEEAKCSWLEGCCTFSMYMASLSLRTIISFLSLVRVLRNSWFSAAATSKSMAGCPPGPKHTMAPALTLKKVTLNAEQNNIQNILIHKSDVYAYAGTALTQLTLFPLCETCVQPRLSFFLPMLHACCQPRLCRSSQQRHDGTLS